MCQNKRNDIKKQKKNVNYEKSVLETYELTLGGCPQTQNFRF